MRIFSPSTEIQRLYELSDGSHILVATPDDADIIIIRLQWENRKEIEEHEIYNRFPEKSFAVSGADLPRYSMHGVYTSVEGLVPRLGGRIRAGCYLLHVSPLIQDEPTGAGILFSKEYFFSFIGRNSHPVRQALFRAKYQRKDVLIEDSTACFSLWGDNRDVLKIEVGQKRFCGVLKKSKFALCPRGVGPSSIRLFEALKLGVAPVILSDGWTFPQGPNWSDFSVLVPEKYVGELDRILVEYEPDHESMGKQAADAYESWFAEKAYFNFLVENCCDIARKQWVRERIAQSILKSAYSLQATFAQARRRMGIRTRLKRILDMERKDSF